MSRFSYKKSDWQLMRERFQIEDHEPPAPKRGERAIGALLADVLAEEPQGEPLPALITARWEIIVGKQISAHTAPISLDNGILLIHADHPGWLAEVRRLPKSHLLKKITSIPGLPEIRDVRFQLDPSLCTGRARRQ